MKKKTYIIVLFLCMAVAAFAQGRTVIGHIEDIDGEPLAGVAIQVKGQMLGTVSTADGDYKIEEVPDNSVLVYHFIGMKTTEIPVGKKSVINVVLEPDNIVLDEVLAVGYGTKKKESLTSAISSLKSEELATTVNSSLAQSLQGKVAGLQIRQNTGEPGAFNTGINIRGFGGAPLYVIDGVAGINSSEFQRLSSEDIESISVLKDAAAAIYGLWASNGVILVTTKKGTRGKAKLTYDLHLGIATPTDTPRMANAYEYVTMVNRARRFSGVGPQYSDEEVIKYKTGEMGYEGTDWGNLAFKKLASSQKHSVALSGGNKFINYYTGFNFTEDEGMLRTNSMNYKNYSFRANLSSQVTKSLKLEYRLYGNVDERRRPTSDFEWIHKATVVLDPTIRPYANENINYPGFIRPLNQHPVAMSQTDISGYRRGESKTFNSTFSFTWNFPFLKELQITGCYTYYSVSSKDKLFSPVYNLYVYDENYDTYNPHTIGSESIISNNWADWNKLNFQTQISYKHTFAEKHNIYATVVYESTKNRGRSAWLKRHYDFVSNDQINLGSEDEQKNSGMESQEGYMSVIGRFNYDHAGKYLIEFAFREDGSYRYNPEHRWGFFPVVTGGWRMSEEPFIKNNAPVISNFKIRTSYGVVGQDAGTPFQYYGGFVVKQPGYEFENGSLTDGTKGPLLTNPDLTWFKARTADVGFDFGLWKNAFTLEFDLYQRDRSGLLATRNVSLPNTYGGALAQENLNSDRVRGLDFMISYKGQKKDFFYQISANLNYARYYNRYVEHGPYNSSWDIWRGAYDNRLQGWRWGFHTNGQFQNEDEIANYPMQSEHGNAKELPGDYKLVDRNGDGLIDGNDQYQDFMDGTPKLHYGLTFSAQWKGLDFSILFQGAALYSLRFQGPYAEFFCYEGNLPKYFMESWTQNEDDTWNPGKWPANRYIRDVGAFYSNSDVWIRDASYLRIKTIDLGYTLKNQPWLKRIGVHSVRFSFNAHNLFTFADKFVKPFDPEKVEGAYAAGDTYPIMQSFNFGLNVTF